MIDTKAVEPSAELRALYLELTAALVRIEGILQPTVEKARQADRMINDEGQRVFDEVLGDPIKNHIDSAATNEFWRKWQQQSGEDEMSAALDRVSKLLHEYCPGCELP